MLCFFEGFPCAVPEALVDPGTNPWALAVLLWLALVNTALVLFLETEALESASASGEQAKWTSYTIARRHNVEAVSCEKAVIILGANNFNHVIG